MLKKVSAIFGVVVAFAFAFVSSASAQISTSTVGTMVTTATSDAWDYISAVLTSALPFAVGISVLAGALYFILKRLRVIR